MFFDVLNFTKQRHESTSLNGLGEPVAHVVVVCGAAIIKGAARLGRHVPVFRMHLPEAQCSADGLTGQKSKRDEGLPHATSRAPFLRQGRPPSCPCNGPMWAPDGPLQLVGEIYNV